MSELATYTTNIFSIATLVANIFIICGALSLVAIFFKRPITLVHPISKKAADHAFLIGFIISFTSVVASMFYSNIIGFEACELCWWQRVFLYPQAILFAIALYNERKHNLKDELVFLYSLILSSIGGAIALFQYYGQMFNPDILGICTSDGGTSCAKLFFVSFGYITIPMMSLTAYLVVILLFFFRRHHQKPATKI